MRKESAEIPFFDAHCHVNFSAFREDYRQTILRAREAGVFLVNVGTQKDTSQRAVQIAHEYAEAVYATVGLHPVHTSRSHHDTDELGATDEAAAFTSRGEEFDFEYYKKLAIDSRVVAIGECGLDYYRIKNQELRIKEKQGEVFIRHIELAHEVQKPLMIHCREAFSDLITILKAHSRSFTRPPGIAHFFGGTKAEARELLDMGFYFTFGGVVTFTRDYDEVVRYVPPDRILSETDAPYVAPVPYRGKRNEPAFVVEVIKKLAGLKGLSVEEVRERIWENARAVFGVG